MSIALRPYQKIMIEEIENSWKSGARNVVAVAPCGAGKTTVFGEILRTHVGASCAIAHRRELVGQMSTTLARLGVRHNIVAPTSTIGEIVTRHIQETGHSYYNALSPCAVAGVDTLVRRKMDAWADKVTLWITDECFPAGTLVDGRPIESLRPGDEVTAFDEATGRFVQKPVIALFKNPEPEYMMRLQTAKHHVIDCTLGHPFWTRRGWVVAAELTEQDEVLAHVAVRYVQAADQSGRNEGPPEVSVSENREDVLFDQMRNGVSGISANRGMVSQKDSNRTDRSELLYVRQTLGPVRKPSGAMEGNSTVVLQSDVLECLSSATQFRDRLCNQPKVRVGTHETSQPDEKSRYPEENAGVVGCDIASTPRQRREQPTAYCSRDESGNHIARQRFPSSSGDPYGDATFECVPNSIMLQTGPGEFFVESGDRSGRQFARRQEADTRSEKGLVFEWTRLDRIEVYEPPNPDRSDGGTRDGFVYNIAVAEHHTYVANGIVVHNCHHLQAKNKWGKAVSLFPNARGLGVTATPERADGRGLDRTSDGLIDAMVLGPTMRNLISQGYLTEYRIFAPKSDIDLAHVPVSDSTGDYSPPALRDAARKSHITGDLVESYLKIAPGRLGVTFCVSVELAGETAARYRAAGVPAEVVSAETPELARAAILRKFASREIMQLVNVDLFGEGFDLPAIEVVGMGRPTQSYALYYQQFGRGLRPLEGKQHAIIIDHVGNVMRHGLPDAPRTWSLDRRERRSRGTPDDVIPVKACPACTAVYERFHRACPFCGHVPVPISRAAPSFVDGDLLELDPATLERLRGAALGLMIDGPKFPYGCSEIVAAAIRKQHREMVAAQVGLRQTIALWAGWQQTLGRSDSESYRRFYLDFGTDVASAQTLRRAEAAELQEKIAATMRREGIAA